MKILRPCGSKKIAKETQRHSTRTNRGEYHAQEGSRRSSWRKEENQCDQWPPWFILGGVYDPS